MHRQKAKHSDSESDFLNSEDGLLLIILGIQDPVTAPEDDTGKLRSLILKLGFSRLLLSKSN